MQFINNQYKIIDMKYENKYGNVFVVEDILKANAMKYLRTVELQKDTEDFIEYMKHSYYDYVNFNNPCMARVNFFNKIRTIDNKMVVSNKYYYTYDYFGGTNLFEFAKNADFEVLLDLASQLCTLVKYFHLRGFLLCNVNTNELFVLNDNGKYRLKILSLPFTEGCSKTVLIDKDNNYFKSPEAFQYGQFTKASDIYLVGVILFYMFSGKNIEGSNFRDALAEFNPPENSDLFKIRNIVKKCTVLGVSERYQGAEHIIGDINRFFEKDYSAIQKDYIQAMPWYRTKLAGRNIQLKRIVERVREYYFEDSQNRVTLLTVSADTGISDFMRAVETRCNQEGLEPVSKTLNSSNKSRFNYISSVIKEVVKFFPDKELFDKYAADLSFIISENSQGNLSFIENIHEEDRIRLVCRLGNFILEAASKLHFIFIIDGLQHIDDDSLSVLNYILKSEGKHKLYMILTMDTEVAEGFENVTSFYYDLLNSGCADAFEMENYNIEETAEYIRILLGMAEPPLDFSAKVYKETEGNPDYIYETVYMLHSNNIIFIDDEGHWVFDRVDFDKINVSFNIDEITWDKVNKLNEVNKQILDVVSVFGCSIQPDVLIEMLNIEGEKLYNLLYSLMTINILVRKMDDNGITFDFRSINLKKSIYEKLSAEDKHRYHLKASHILENRFKKDAKENRDEIIRHMAKSGRQQDAIQYLITSADRLIEGNQINQSIQALEQAYELFDKDKVCSKKLDVCFSLGEQHERLANFEKSMAFFNLAETIAKQIGDLRKYVDICINSAGLLYKLGERKKWIAYAIKAKRLAQSEGYTEGIYKLIIALSDIMNARRKFSSFSKVLETAVKNICRDRYQYYYGKLLSVYGRVLVFRNQHDKGLELLKESVTVLEGLGKYKDLPLPLNAIGYVYSDCYNEIKKSREYYERCLGVSQKINDLLFMEYSYNNLAEMYRLEDQYKEALNYFNKAIEVLKIRHDKYSQTLIYINLVMVYTAMEDYNKSEHYMNEVESVLKDLDSKDTGVLLEYLHLCKAHFYYNLGDFDLAHAHAQKTVDVCKSWGIAENLEAHYFKIFSEIKLHNTLDFEKEMAFCKQALGANMFRVLRMACVKFAELYAQKGMADKANSFLGLGLKYAHKIDSEVLTAEYNYVSALAAGEDEKFTRLINLVTLIDGVENNEVKWKIYYALALQLLKRNNLQEALKHLISALNVLRRLVHNVGDAYKVRFIFSHERFLIKENLIKISEMLVGKKNTLRGRRFIHYEEADINLHTIDKYFDYTDFMDICREKELSGRLHFRSKDASEEIASFGKLLFRVQELISKFSEDNEANLKILVDMLAETTQASNAFIATLNEDESINVLATYNRYSEIPFYRYIIERARQKRDSIFITDAFEFVRKQGDVLLPKEVTAVFCIPIMTSKSGDPLDIAEDRRRFKEQDNSPIIGYLYLDTDSIINNFTEDSTLFCTMLSRLAYLLVDNYNLKIVSTVDKLTKLYTRKFFEGALQSQMDFAEKNGGVFSLVMVDIDKFKSVNDRFGHQKGDEILQNVSGIIMSNVNKSDVCARYGGEEIIIMLPDVDAKTGCRVAESIRRKVENAKLLGLHNPLTISLGVASYPEHGTWSKDLIEKADQALYRAKESGRNRSYVYEPNMSNSINRVDKLAGIITGNMVDDQRKVETMLEVLELSRNVASSLQEKLFNFLGRIIEVSEAQNGIVFLLNGEQGPGEYDKLSKQIARRKLTDTIVEDPYFNRDLVQKCIKNRIGEYMIDWGNYPGIDTATGMPDWQSVIVLPLINNRMLQGILYLSVPIRNKEFDANTFNFIKTLCDIVSSVF